MVRWELMANRTKQNLDRVAKILRPNLNPKFGLNTEAVKPATPSYSAALGVNENSGSVGNVAPRASVSAVASQAGTATPGAKKIRSYTEWLNENSKLDAEAVKSATPSYNEMLAEKPSYQSAPPTNNGEMTENAVSARSYESNGVGTIDTAKAEVLSALEKESNAVNNQYQSALGIADKAREDSYQKALDEQRVAMRDAQANYKQNDTRYGAAAESLLAQGLENSGYSEYLLGKREEQLTDERMAANSQYSYARMLADEKYDQAKATAEANKWAGLQGIEQSKASYATQLGLSKAQLEAEMEQFNKTQEWNQLEYDLRQQLVEAEDEGTRRNSFFNGYLAYLEDVSNGKMSAEAAIKGLGAVSGLYGYWDDSMAAALNAAEAAYSAKNSKTERLNAYTALLNSCVQLEQAPAYDIMNEWLGMLNISEGARAQYLNTFYDSDRNWIGDMEKLENLIDNKVNVGSSEDGGKDGEEDVAYDWSDGIVIKDADGKESQVTFEFAEGQEEMLNEIYRNNNEKFPDSMIVSEAEKNASVSQGANESDFFKLSDGSYIVFKTTSASSGNTNEGSSGSASVDVESKLMNSDIIVSTGARFNTDGSAIRTDKMGDNFSVDYNGKKYRVQNGGKATELSEADLEGINVGNVFAKKGQLYIKTESGVYKLAARDLLFSSGSYSYDKLKEAIYADAAAKASVGEDGVVSYAKEIFEQSDVKEREGGVVGNFLGELSDHMTEFNPGRKQDEAMNDVLNGNTGSGITNKGNDSTDEGGSSTNEPEITSKPEISRGYAWVSKGSEGRIKVNVNGNQYKVRLDEADDSISAEAMDEAGVNNNEVFIIGGQAYARRGNIAYKINKRVLSAGQYAQMLADIENNVGDQIVKDGEDGYQGYAIGLGASGSVKGLGYNKNVDIKFLEAFYQLNIDAVLDNSTDAFKAALEAGIGEGEVFAHGEDMYIRDSNYCYKLGARGGGNNGDYDALKRAVAGYLQNREYTDVTERDDTGNTITRRVEIPRAISEDSIIKNADGTPLSGKAAEVFAKGGGLVYLKPETGDCYYGPDAKEAYDYLMENGEEGYYTYKKCIYNKVIEGGEVKIYRLYNPEMLRNVFSHIDDAKLETPFGNYMGAYQKN
jgi:hypothetical protein